VAQNFVASSIVIALNWVLCLALLVVESSFVDYSGKTAAFT